MPALERRTVDLPPLSVRAAIAPKSIDEESRKVGVTFTTGAPVTRWDWMTGTRYIEKLSMDPAHVRLGRLNSGAPLLDTHSAYALSSVMGVVEDDTAKLSGKKGEAVVRFSRRDDVEPYWQDVKDRVIRNVSVGYIVHRYEETPGKDNKLPVRLAVDWEPYEISLVPMPADAGAQTRDGKPAEGTHASLHPCVIETRGELAEEEETVTMPEQRTAPESIVERNPLDPGAPTAQPDALRLVPAEPNDRDRGVEAERTRVNGIRAACVAARMSRDFEQGLVDSGETLEACQGRVFEELRKRGYDNAGPSHVTVRERSLDGDPHVHQTEGIKDAILHRLNPTHFELTEKGRAYRGLSMLDIAKIYLQARGLRVTDLNKNEVAAIALGMQSRGVGMHTTSDFPLLLADVATKSLRKSYEEAPQTFKAFASRITLTNYRPTSMVQFGDAPALLEVVEHGEYKSGTIGEAKEAIQLRKYGRKFAITREAMINDDVDAFSRVPMMFGRKARALESDIVYEQITSNPTMGDGNPLFSIAHANIASTDAAIDVTSLGAGRSALRQQRSVDGEYLNLMAKYLIVPPGMETLADQYVTVIQAQLGSNVNPFQGKLQVITDPRLTNAYEWYLATGAEFEWLVYGYLEGEEGPQVETRNGFDIDGLEIKCRLDFTAKVIDWRGIYRNEGNT